MERIIVDNIPVDIDWKDIKNMHLTVYPPEGRVHVSAPLMMTEENIRMFLVTKLPWLHEKLDAFKKQERQPEREYVSGEDHYFLGHRYRLKVVPTTGASSVSILNNDFLEMKVRNGATEERKEEVMKEWYRVQLRPIIEEYVAKWEPVLGVQNSGWKIQEMKTLWGSCNHRTKHLLFNLELAKKPLHCIEYVVVHELAHINQRLHNAEFVSILDNALPNWRATKDELNEFVI